MQKALYQKIKISKSYIFIAVVMLFKLLLMGICSSDYQNKLFLPFMVDFFSNGGNVYQRFWEQGITNAFPYPAMMLLIQCIGVLPIYLFKITNIFWVNFFFKLPSFLIDVLGLVVLYRIYPQKGKYIAVFYYASPIIIYGVYMHGQLDLIPTMLAVFAVCMLASKYKLRYVSGAIFMILALLCKLHILAIMPIVVLYLMKRDGIWKGVAYAVTTALGVIIGIIPVLSEGFIYGVLFNAEQNLLTQVHFDFVYVQMYLPILAVFMIYISSYKFGYINNGLFINLCSIVFAVFLSLCPPMPGWYVWVVPYFAIFFANIEEEKHKNIVIYAVMNLLYLAYFLFLHDRGFVDLYIFNKSCAALKISNVVARNGLFTILSSTLLYLVFCMYKLGVISNSLYKRRNVPFTIGIAGDSGIGKSTMISVIEKCLGKNNLQFIEGDGDHKWERGDEYWSNYTALNPKANYLYRQAEDLKQLRIGNTVRRVDYDHDTGKFTDRKRIKANKYIILCGLHSIYLPQTRKNLDIKIYMDADETLRRFWKMKRDIAKRGYSREQIVEQIESRLPDAEKYIYPQKKYADLTIYYYDKTLDDCMNENHDVKLSLQLTISSVANVEPLVDELINNGLSVRYDYSDDLNTQIIEIDAEDMESIVIPVNRIAKNVIPQLEEITGENLDKDINAKDAVIILFLLLLISTKMQGL